MLARHTRREPKVSWKNITIYSEKLKNYFSLLLNANHLGHF
jgi:hypothetical protein